MKNLEIVQNYLDGIRPYPKIGWTPDAPEARKVGDVWTDADGFMWEQKNGFKVKRSRHAEIFEKIKSDTKCECGQEVRWMDARDKKAYKKTGLCFECLIKRDTKLRIDGKWQDHEQLTLKRNEISYYKDMSKMLTDWIAALNSEDRNQIVYETGMVEDWTNTERKKMLREFKKDQKNLTKKIVQLETEIKAITG